MQVMAKKLGIRALVNMPPRRFVPLNAVQLLVALSPLPSLYTHPQ
jgi:hypothetical protein